MANNTGVRREIPEVSRNFPALLFPVLPDCFQFPLLFPGLVATPPPRKKLGVSMMVGVHRVAMPAKKKKNKKMRQDET